MNVDFKTNLNSDICIATFVGNADDPESCPLLFRIKEGHQRYGIGHAVNKLGNRMIYFRFGVGEQTAKKEDGEWMDNEEIFKESTKWLVGFELNSVRQAEVLAEMFQEAVDFLKEKEKRENEPEV